MRLRLRIEPSSKEAPRKCRTVIGIGRRDLMHMCGKCPGPYGEIPPRRLVIDGQEVGAP